MDEIENLKSKKIRTVRVSYLANRSHFSERMFCFLTVVGAFFFSTGASKILNPLIVLALCYRKILNVFLFIILVAIILYYIAATEGLLPAGDFSANGYVILFIPYVFVYLIYSSTLDRTLRTGAFRKYCILDSVGWMAWFLQGTLVTLAALYTLEDEPALLILLATLTLLALSSAALRLRDARLIRLANIEENH